MIVKGHSRQVGIDMLAFKPPFEKIVVFDVFRPGGKVSCKFVTQFVSCLECREAVKKC